MKNKLVVWEPTFEGLLELRQEIYDMREKIKIIRSKLQCLEQDFDRLPYLAHYVNSMDAISRAMVHRRLCPCSNICGRAYQDIDCKVSLPAVMDIESQVEAEIEAEKTVAASK